MDTNLSTPRAAITANRTKPSDGSKSQERPEISIVTVGMNHCHFLKNYLKSLYVSNPPTVSFELIYVDNCSVDESLKLISENFPQVKVIQNSSVKGFAYNNNLGVSRSSGKYILILNPDVIILPGSIDKMHEYLKAHKRVGILVPKLLNQDLSPQYSVRKFMSLKIMISRLLNHGRDNIKSTAIGDYLLSNLDRMKTQAVDWALGAAMLFDRLWYEKLHGFDEKYFLYVEDTDICLKSWKLGRPVIYFPEALFVHIHQRASNKKFTKTKMIHLKSLIRFFFKHNLLFKSYSFAKRLNEQEPNYSVQL